MGRENECGSKRTYRSKSQAKQSERRLRTVNGGRRQHAYRCSYCGMFHLGHGHIAFDSPRAPRPPDAVKRTKDALRKERHNLGQATDPKMIARHEKRIAEIEQHLASLREETA